MTRKTIQTPDAPEGDRTRIRRRSRPATPSTCPDRSASIPRTGQMVEGTEAQAHRVLQNLRAVARAAGGDLDDIVKVTLLLADMADFAQVNEIMTQYFKPPYPVARDVSGGRAAQGRARRNRRRARASEAGK